jgi:hypothetical protein
MSKNKILGQLFLAICFFAPSFVSAGIIVSFEENGGVIDVTVSGSADVSGFTGGTPFIYNQYGQNTNFMLIGNGAVTRWDGFEVAGGFTGSMNTAGLLNFSAAYTGTSLPVGILPNRPAGDPTSGVYLPTGYAGEVLSATGSFAADFAKLGVAEGDVFSVAWESNGLQSVEFVMGSRVVNVPNAAPLALLAIGLAGIGFSRKKA